ncbi:phage tail sheath C-terminal domain-containing protein [Massilia sp. BJB1822]|uniref:phage tail sheath family protein n=1 Tax=Massilia sp. BJB1822 TaxID=2744470 RepID=UPI00159377F1|nr:phage tail sheath C-terminal domain-containing protein [Massilia sp. BJB1822]NVD97965.1 phage tail sheath family protein [Massilia sp. BJB1822]
MLADDSPGVYWEQLDGANRAIAPARMDVLGLVGIARKGPLDQPVAVENMRQFETRFGSFTGAGYLAYAAKAFFDNGGRRAWIVRVAARDGANAAAAAYADVRLPALPGLAEAAGVWRIAAASPGAWGNALRVTLEPGRRVAAVSIAQGSTRTCIRVGSTAGFARDTLLRLSQGGAVLLRILAAVDAQRKLLHLVHPDADLRRPTDLDLAALDPGQPIRVEALRYDLAVREDGRLVASIADLSLVPDDARHGPRLLAGAGAPTYTDSEAVAEPPFPVTIAALSGAAAAASAPAAPLAPAGGVVLAAAGGCDGLAALAVEDFIGAPIAAIDGPDARRRGLQALARLRQPALVAIPDICIQPLPLLEIEPARMAPADPCAPCRQPPPAAPPAPRPPPELPPRFSDADIARVQQALVEDCAQHQHRFALLDPPYRQASDAQAGVTGLQDWRRRFDTRHAALYAPWISVTDPLRPGAIRQIPPSGHVAGQYALAEALEGVHRAPANRDLAWAEGCSMAIDAARHGMLNAEGINLIRPALGRALRIAGARTLSSDPDARYVPVRRLLMYLLRSFEQASQWLVFEPNDHATRAALAHAMNGFLDLLWQQGALAGGTPDAAYALRCDESNNPQAERDNGRLHCDIAVAPVIPYEFVVLRLGRSDNTLDVSERTLRPAWMEGAAS